MEGISTLPLRSEQESLAQWRLSELHRLFYDNIAAGITAYEGIKKFVSTESNRNTREYAAADPRSQMVGLNRHSSRRC